MTAVDPVIGRSRFKASGDQRHGNRSGNRILEHSRCVADPWQQKQQKGHLEIFFFFWVKNDYLLFFLFDQIKERQLHAIFCQLFFPWPGKELPIVFTPLVSCLLTCEHSCHWVIFLLFIEHFSLWHEIRDRNWVKCVLEFWMFYRLVFNLIASCYTPFDSSLNAL